MKHSERESSLKLDDKFDVINLNRDILYCYLSPR